MSILVVDVGKLKITLDSIKESVHCTAQETPSIANKTYHYFEDKCMIALSWR